MKSKLAAAAAAAAAAAVAAGGIYYYLLYLYIYIYIYIYKAENCLSVCLSDGHAAYSPDLARIDIVCADNEALIIRLL